MLGVVLVDIGRQDGRLDRRLERGEADLLVRWARSLRRTCSSSALSCTCIVGCCSTTYAQQPSVRVELGCVLGRTEPFVCDVEGRAVVGLQPASHRGRNRGRGHDERSDRPAASEAVDNASSSEYASLCLARRVAAAHAGDHGLQTTETDRQRRECDPGIARAGLDSPDSNSTRSSARSRRLSGLSGRRGKPQATESALDCKSTRPPTSAARRRASSLSCSLLHLCIPRHIAHAPVNSRARHRPECRIRMLFAPSPNAKRSTSEGHRACLRRYSVVCASVLLYSPGCPLHLPCLCLLFSRCALSLLPLRTRSIQLNSSPMSSSGRPRWRTALATARPGASSSGANSKLLRAQTCVSSVLT